DIYAQRINGSGFEEWTGNGKVICSHFGNEYATVIPSNGSGSTIIAWEDNRGGPTNGSEVYAQRISASGTVLWTTNGVAVCAGSGVQNILSIISDGAGGAVIAWEDSRNGA